jgi:hypothetical protein
MKKGMVTIFLILQLFNGSLFGVGPQSSDQPEYMGESLRPDAVIDLGAKHQYRLQRTKSESFIAQQLLQQLHDIHHKVDDLALVNSTPAQSANHPVENQPSSHQERTPSPKHEIVIDILAKLIRTREQVKDVEKGVAKLVTLSEKMDNSIQSGKRVCGLPVSAIHVGQTYMLLFLVGGIIACIYYL